MWETWVISQKLRVTPSQYIHLQDPILCYYFDRAVWLFGSSVEADLNAVDANAGKNAKSVPSRKQMVLNQWIPAKNGNSQGRFRDPAFGAKR